MNSETSRHPEWPVQWALTADSTYTYGLKMRVTVRAMQENHAAVLPLARRLARQGRQDVGTATAHGVAAERMGLAPEAIAAYRRAVSLDPNRVDLWERAAGLHLQLGEYADAEKQFATLRQGEPENLPYTLGLADAMWQDFRRRPSARSYVPLAGEAGNR